MVLQQYKTFFECIVLDRTGPALAFEQYSDWSDRNAIIEGQKGHYGHNTHSILVKLEQMYCPVMISPICVSCSNFVFICFGQVEQNKAAPNYRSSKRASTAHSSKLTTWRASYYCHLPRRDTKGSIQWR